SYTWKYDGYPGNSLVTFELFKEGNKTRLKLTHEKLETLGDNSDFARENFVEGWTHLIEESFKKFVENTSI
ncbi:MAG: SRPBCC domain-containing protein, partial [Ignavibacteriales bacterium]